MIRKVQFEEIPEEEEWNPDIVARLHIDPPLDTALIKRVETIKGVGWVDDGVDYAAIHLVSPGVILLESGCPAVWCEHMQRLVYDIVEALKEAGEVNYIGPAIDPPFLKRRSR
jgi:hypothetical protein